MSDLHQFAWIIHALGLVLVLWALTHIFHIDLPALVRLVFREIQDLIKLKPSIGAFNMAGFVLLLIFGVFVIIAMKLEHAIQLVSKFINPGKVYEFTRAASFDAMFYFLAVILILSLTFTALSEFRKRRK